MSAALRASRTASGGPQLTIPWASERQSARRRISSPTRGITGVSTVARREAGRKLSGVEQRAKRRTGPGIRCSETSLCGPVRTQSTPGLGLSPQSRSCFPPCPLTLTLASLFIGRKSDFDWIGRPRKALALFLIGVFVYFSVASTHGYLAWNRAGIQA